MQTLKSKAITAIARSSPEDDSDSAPHGRTLCLLREDLDKGTLLDKEPPHSQL